MDSITKSKLTCEQVKSMVRRAFGDKIEVETIIELTEGYYNTAYMVTLANGLKTVLKISPPKDVLVMRYEKNIMETEVFVLNKIGSIKEVPVPKVLYYDHSGGIIENNYFFMEFIDGTPLNKIKSELTEEQNREISSELGGFVKQIHSMEGDYFGYISQEDKKFQTWDEAFLYMIKELLDDAVDAKVVLPYDNDRIFNMVYERRSILKKVNTPSLIHKDLWPGNIFVHPGTAKITGLLDCERAIYGDTLMEPVCGFLLDNEDFMKAYRGGVQLTEEEKVRTVLYKVYLFLIMTVECSYRRYPDENIYKWTFTELKAALDNLNEH